MKFYYLPQNFQCHILLNDSNTSTIFKHLQWFIYIFLKLNSRICKILYINLCNNIRIFRMQDCDLNYYNHNHERHSFQTVLQKILNSFNFSNMKSIISNSQLCKNLICIQQGHNNGEIALLCTILILIENIKYLKSYSMTLNNKIIKLIF